MNNRASKDSKLTKQLVILPCLVLLIPFAMAAAPTIGGSVVIDVTVGNIVNFAEAIDSVAQVAIGSVSEGSLGGFNSTVVVGDVINQATGNGSCSQVLVGSAGIPSCVAGTASGN